MSRASGNRCPQWLLALSRAPLILLVVLSFSLPTAVCVNTADAGNGKPVAKSQKAKAPTKKQAAPKRQSKISVGKSAGKGRGAKKQTAPYLRKSRVASPRVVERYLQRQFKREGLTEKAAREKAKSYVKSFSGPIRVRMTKPGERFRRYTDRRNSSGDFLTKQRANSRRDADKKFNIKKWGTTGQYRQAWLATRPSILLEGKVRGGSGIQSLRVDAKSTLSHWRYGTGKKYD